MYAPGVIHRVTLACAWFGSALALGCVRPDAEDGETTTSTESGESGEGGEFASLIDHLLWEDVDPADDPLPDHRPEMVVCGLAAWYYEPESAALEIDTNVCNYLEVGQPSLVAVEQGQTMQVILYHFDLVALEPATAHVAILLDGQVLWEREIAIPGEADVYVEEFESPISAELGSPVVLHLHNHGQNTWRLQELQVKP